MTAGIAAPLNLYPLVGGRVLPPSGHDVGRREEPGAPNLPSSPTSRQGIEPSPSHRDPGLRPRGRRRARAAVSGLRGSVTYLQETSECRATEAGPPSRCLRLVEGAG